MFVIGAQIHWNAFNKQKETLWVLAIIKTAILNVDQSMASFPNVP